MKTSNKIFNFDMKMLDSPEGRLKFREEIENMGISHLNIPMLLSNLNYED